MAGIYDWEMHRLAIGAVVIGLFAAGCLSESNSVSSPAPESVESISLIIPDQDSDYFRAIRLGALDAARDQGLDMNIPEAASTTSEQIAAVTEAIARGDSGIAIAPVGTDVDAALSVARSAGLKVVEVGGTGVDVANVDFTVQSVDCLLGMAAGQWLAGRMPQGAIFWPDFNAHFLRVIGVTGEYPVPTCRDRAWLEGLGIDPATIEALPPGELPSGMYADNAASFDIPCTIVYAGDLHQVTEDVRECVLEHPEINAAYASSGDLAQAMGDGLRFAGKTVGVDVKVTTVGGTGEALELADGGWVNATSRPRVRSTGYDSVASLRQLIRGETPEFQGDRPIRDTGVDLCTDESQRTVFVAFTLPVGACVERLSEVG